MCLVQTLTISIRKMVVDCSVQAEVQILALKSRVWFNGIAIHILALVIHAHFGLYFKEFLFLRMHKVRTHCSQEPCNQDFLHISQNLIIG